MINKIFKKVIRTFVGLIALSKIIIKKRKNQKLFDLKLIELRSEDSIFNLSVAKYGDLYLVMGREYTDEIQPRNYKKIYFGSFEDIDCIKIDSINDVDCSVLSNEIEGFVRLEDPRIFILNKTCIIMCVCISNNGDSFLARQILIKLENLKVIDYVIYETKNTIEKNWIPLSFNDNKIEVLYSVNPYKLINLEVAPKFKINKILIDEIKEIKYRNSTNYIQINDAEIAMCHEYIDIGYRSLCVHFFVKKRGNKILEISEKFIFSKISKEYATSMVATQENNIIVFYSDHLRGNYVARTSIKLLSSLTWKVIE